ncbi:MAG: mechanosensitive ion channel family protein [Bacteroidota bacterium]
MENLFSQEFWSDLVDKSQTWIIEQLPGIIFIVLAVFITLRIVSYSLKKLKKAMVDRAARHEKVDASEAEKRLNTLFGIIEGVTKIVLFFVLIMVILKKVGVDIAPILASAGIIGLAVGFGAQELVRDFITGFFILLENQLRAGDVAIINGTGGLVE